MGRRLINNLLYLAWRIEVTALGFDLTTYPQTVGGSGLPHHVLISFFERHPALIKAVEIVLPAASCRPASTASASTRSVRRSGSS
jgi:hypothetical protein